MPIYEFICHNCGAEFEKLVSFSDNSSVSCPTCQSTQVQRQMGLPAIHFKGSGWYITDSKKSEKSIKNPASDNGSSDSDAKSGAESGAESSGQSEGGTSESSSSSSGDSASSSSTQQNTDTTAQKK